MKTGETAKDKNATFSVTSCSIRPLSGNLMSDRSKSIRIATAADVARVIPVMNAAFAIEEFIDGPRTNEVEMAESMGKGQFLILEDDAGGVLASIYVEPRGDRGYFGMLAVDPERQGLTLWRVMVEAAERRCRDRGCRHLDIAVLSPRGETRAVLQQTRLCPNRL
jgi:GNAT superfamily N-acetyltransferase